MYEHDTINDIISDINKCEHYRDSICVRFNDMHYYKKIIVMMRNNYYIQMNSYQYIQFLQYNEINRLYEYQVIN